MDAGEWRVKRALRLAPAVFFVAAVCAAPALGHVLSIEAAHGKARAYAQRACEGDRYCVRDGVSSCRRKHAHVVTCDVFNDRDTPAQGRYRCLRLVRIAYTTSYSTKPAITGFGNWRC